ncbi:hypothetical protein Gohar_024503 [Gossypium harknessii]|uniref:Uncharacterized protein n=1 Tax=Gossypium harknessii TaxID=34285 RepID=A0A7J9HGA9_9ROSI|nr:hypothetical protein [Gossypium harknessii]
MASFKHLYLSDNQLRDGIQGILRNICTLQTLDLSHNNLTGLFPQLPRCIESSLEIFNLDWNSLHGFRLTSSKLVVLVLDGNQLTGPLPNFCNKAFMSLEELDISHNRFNGTVTESLGCLSRLKHLLASQNSIEVLEFQTPYLLGYGTSPYLYFLNLSNNQMSGILPDLLSPNTLFITEMDLSSNMFDGSLPLLPYINVLNLTKTRFTGSLDPFCKITSKYLTFLEVSGKLFSGELSECLFPWKQLLVLNLDNNNFSGEILTFLGSLFSLKALNLHNNNFSGEIPLSLKDCSNLIFLDLSSLEIYQPGSVKTFHLWYSLAYKLTTSMEGYLPTLTWMFFFYSSS